MLEQTPPIEEFIATQAELRALTGSPVIYHVPQVPTWPEYAAWDGEESYVVGDKVSAGGKAYEATANSLGDEPPDEVRWKEISLQTKINPDTELPYDSTVERTNAAYVDITKTCIIIKKQASPLRPQADTQLTAEGEGSGVDTIIDIGGADYEDVEDATTVTMEGFDYRIRESKPFSIGGKIYRFLVYAQGM